MERLTLIACCNARMRRGESEMVTVMFIAFMCLCDHFGVEIMTHRGIFMLVFAFIHDGATITQKLSGD